MLSAPPVTNPTPSRAYLLKEEPQPTLKLPADQILDAIGEWHGKAWHQRIAEFVKLRCKEKLPWASSGSPFSRFLITRRTSRHGSFFARPSSPNPSVNPQSLRGSYTAYRCRRKSMTFTISIPSISEGQLPSPTTTILRYSSPMRRSEASSRRCVSSSCIFSVT